VDARRAHGVQPLGIVVDDESRHIEPPHGTSRDIGPPPQGGISFAPGMAWEVVFSTECSKMTLSIDGLQDGVRSKTVYRPTADLKRRISTLKRLITDCDRIAADLDQEIQREEERVRIHDPAHFAYSIYAGATTSYAGDWVTRSIRRRGVPAF
jgi:hypothetical protein